MPDDLDRNRLPRHDVDGTTWEVHLRWAEFGAWCVLVLTPLLWWFNGPSVSTDQLYVRRGLLFIAFVAVAGTRTAKWNLRCSEARSHVTTSCAATVESLRICGDPNVLLSVIVPVYNERDTLVRSLDRLVTAVPSLELILVDDASTDGSAEIVKALVLPVPVTKCFHKTNLGKGAAIRTAIPHARGRYIVMHDADLEYDPQDLPLLMEHLETTQAEAVYGKRFHQQAQPCLWHAWGNRSLSRIFSLVTGTPIADIETCYKMILRERLQDIAPRLRESRFGIEIELTARLVACGTQITELPIRFERRGYPQGKKIGWRDGVSAFRCILRYGPSIRLARRQRR